MTVGYIAILLFCFQNKKKYEHTCQTGQKTCIIWEIIIQAIVFTIKRLKKRDMD